MCPGAVLGHCVTLRCMDSMSLYEDASTSKVWCEMAGLLADRVCIQWFGSHMDSLVVAMRNCSI